jgi:hypothetical protein
LTEQKTGLNVEAKEFFAAFSSTQACDAPDFFCNGKNRMLLLKISRPNSLTEPKSSLSRYERAHLPETP